MRFAKGEAEYRGGVFHPGFTGRRVLSAPPGALEIGLPLRFCAHPDRGDLGHCPGEIGIVGTGKGEPAAH